MTRLLLLAVPLLLAGSVAQSKTLKWMDTAGVGLPAGAKIAVVSGNPAKAGDFTVRIQMPANYAVPPHHHPFEEIVRVKSGTLYYGMSDKLDKGNAGTLNDPGYHVTMHAGMNHWVFTTEPAEVQVSGTGPFQISYVNPADDPRTK